MKNMYTSIKSHLQDNTTQIMQHVHDNTGDGYTWFLFMTVVFLMVFGALFVIMNTAVNMRDIRNDVDEAANDIFVEVREVAYDKITDGATDYSFTELSHADVLQQMATHLNAQYSGSGLMPFAYKVDSRGKLLYRIDNFSFVYIPQVHISDGDESYRVGDVNKDTKVDEEDVQWVEDYINNIKPAADLPQDRFDLNEDGTVDDKDILLCEGLVEYFKAHPEESLESVDEKQSAILMITFQLTVNISYGNMDFGTNVDSYHYYSTMSFKAAR